MAVESLLSRAGCTALSKCNAGTVRSWIDRSLGQLLDRQRADGVIYAAKHRGVIYAAKHRTVVRLARGKYSAKTALAHLLGRLDLGGADRHGDARVADYCASWTVPNAYVAPASSVQDRVRNLFRAPHGFRPFLASASPARRATSFKIKISSAVNIGLGG
jgi:hypothetical protein